MKVFAIILGCISVMLAIGAGLRLATMEFDTRPVVDIGLMADRDFDEYEMIREEQEMADQGPASATSSSGNQQDIADHLRGNSWEDESSGGADISEEEDFDRAMDVQDNRENDMDDAKNKMKGLL